MPINPTLSASPQIQARDGKPHPFPDIRLEILLPGDVNTDTPILEIRRGDLVRLRGDR